MGYERGGGYRPMIRDLPTADRPRERLRAQGGPALSNAELLAIVLRTGTRAENAVSLATRVLAQFEGLTGLARSTYDELCRVSGLGEAKAAQLLGALELGRRLVAAGPDERPTINSPADVANLLQSDMALLEREHLRVLVLSTRNQVASVSQVYQGSVNSSQVRVSEVFRDAVRSSSPAIVVAHNHPSGDPTPSADDVEVTRAIVQAGKLMDIDVLDHVVVAARGYVSLRERGQGFD